MSIKKKKKKLEKYIDELNELVEEVVDEFNAGRKKKAEELAH